MHFKRKQFTALIIQSYIANSKERQAEINHCVAENMKIPFDEVIVYGDNSFITEEGHRIVKKLTKSRLTFRSFLQEVSSRESLEGFCVLTNSDIILDKGILDKCSRIPTSVLLSISRHEQIGGLVPGPHCSQDTWVLRNQKIRDPLIQASDLPLGTPGCELRFAELMYSSGFKVFNPSLSVNNLHLHSGATRHNDDERHYGAYLFTHPCNLRDVGLESADHTGYPVYLKSGSNLQNILKSS